MIWETYFTPTRPHLNNATVPLQSRRDKRTAKLLLLKLIKRWGFVPKRIITDKLGSYGAAKREVAPALMAEVGTQLFERGRSGAIPTPAGVRFEPHARLLMATWDQACRDTGASRDRDRLLRLAGQFSLMRPVLVEWVTTIRMRDPRTAIDLQADYSLQIMKDLSLGAIDIGLLYSPQYLPDLDIEQVGEEQFVMVSTDSTRLNQVARERYVNTNYTSFFSQRHHELLPELSNAPITVSFEGLAVDCH